MKNRASCSKSIRNIKTWTAEAWDPVNSTSSRPMKPALCEPEPMDCGFPPASALLKNDRLDKVEASALQHGILQQRLQVLRLLEGTWVSSEPSQSVQVQTLALPLISHVTGLGQVLNPSMLQLPHL